MTIDEAIKILEDNVTNIYPEDEGKLNNALKLGIAALIKIRSIRAGVYWPPKFKLPGETKD